METRIEQPKQDNQNQATMIDRTARTGQLKQNSHGGQKCQDIETRKGSQNKTARTGQPRRIGQIEKWTPGKGCQNRTIRTGHRDGQNSQDMETRIGGQYRTGQWGRTQIEKGNQNRTGPSLTPSYIFYSCKQCVLTNKIELCIITCIRDILGLEQFTVFSFAYK